MKKLFFIFTMLLCVLMAVSVATAEVYANTAVIVAVENYKVFLKDFHGNIWSFEEDDEWNVGDVVSLLMDDNDTWAETDDMIIDKYYSGLSLHFTGGF